MAQITQFRLSSGEILYVEAAASPVQAGEQRAAIETIGKYLNGEGRAEGQQPDLESRISPVIGALKALREKLVAVGTPDEIELEAGLKFVGEAGIVLSKWGSEASISIRITWKKDDQEKPDKS
jgi:hypothetical protein